MTVPFEAIEAGRRALSAAISSWGTPELRREQARKTVQAAAPHIRRDERRAVRDRLIHVIATNIDHGPDTVYAALLAVIRDLEDGVS